MASRDFFQYQMSQFGKRQIEAHAGIAQTRCYKQDPLYRQMPNALHRCFKRSRAQYLPFAVSARTPAEVQRWVAELLLPSGDVVLAHQSGKNLAVMAMSESDGVSWIDQLYVAPGYLRRGIGSALLNHALANLPRPIRLWTFQQNDRAIQFYQQHGFKMLTQTNVAVSTMKKSVPMHFLSYAINLLREVY